MLRGNNVSLKLRRNREVFTVDIIRDKVSRRRAPLPTFDSEWADSISNVSDVLEAIHAMDPQNIVSADAVRCAARRIAALPADDRAAALAREADAIAAARAAFCGVSIASQTAM